MCQFDNQFNIGDAIELVKAAINGEAFKNPGESIEKVLCLAGTLNRQLLIDQAPQPIGSEGENWNSASDPHVLRRASEILEDARDNPQVANAAGPVGFLGGLSSWLLMKAFEVILRRILNQQVG